MFAAPLQALVTDSVGNPVSGVPVTFTVPATDRERKLFRSADSNYRSGWHRDVARADGEQYGGRFFGNRDDADHAGVATFALVILPPTSGVLTLDQQVLTFVSEIDQTAPPPKTVTVSAVSGSGSSCLDNFEFGRG